MNHLRVIIFLGIGISRLICHGNFENECDILQRLDQLEKKVQSSDEKIEVLSAKLETANLVIDQLQDHRHSGSTYVRWGRTTCPDKDSDLVYEGVTGGSYHTSTGAAANYLCMPSNPDYDNNTAAGAQGYANVYGAEYEITNRLELFDIDYPLFNHDVPCAVCHVPRDAMIMLPAKNKCMDGWTLEYEGMLIAGNALVEAASEYICLDKRPEIVDGGSESKDGKMLYLVESRCGSLPCPPYKEGHELSCVVCTK